MEIMEIFGAEYLTEYLSKYLATYISTGLVFGLFMGTVLEFLGYGVFKALSLLNIK